jgi:excisionase family DNA binding protein
MRAMSIEKLNQTFPETRLAYSLVEAARLTGVGRTFLYGAIAKKELKTCKIGGRRLVTADALRAWLAAHSE